ncbi:DNA topoisomerase I [Candidatus Bathyarchaeota archaeon]|nr:MAG: DNA topoisomerase I [Candidatus Bathyarchaeota archaeon]
MTGKVLVICEKPSAAAKIAAALSAGRPNKREKHGVTYYEFSLNGKRFVVVPALGHLYTLKNTRPLHTYPMYDVEWVPIHEADRNAKRAEPFIRVIRELAKDATEFISACDYDIEGSVVAYNVLRFVCGNGAVQKAKRMKFSTLTAQELRKAYENLMPRLDFELIEAGLTRHELDWYWGMNLSKALSSAVETAEQRFVKLSAGRVQTPTLKILTEREREIEEFEPVPFWEIAVVLRIGKLKVKAQHERGRFWDKTEVERAYGSCHGHNARITKIESRRYRRNPPTPFNLGDLQSEAYRCFGLSPIRTQQIAQDLYQAALISYPRTSSQKLPPVIGYAEIIEKLGKIGREYGRLAAMLLEQERLEPNQGKKEDPAHPAIFPTGEPPTDIRGAHLKVYDLIVRRFFSVFAPPAVVESTKLHLEIGGEPFKLGGRKILDPGWLEFYGKYASSEEVQLPDVKVGDVLKAEEWVLEEKQTQPPPRYNPASIIREMEAKHLGTKGTRGPILQTLYTRGYIVGEQIRVTELGKQVVEALAQYCPEILSEELTAKFELEMEAIQLGKKKREKVLEEAKRKLAEILEKFRLHEAEIGKKLGEAQRVARARSRIIGKCPRCGGDLRIVVSKRSKKRFAGCSNYPRCDFSLPLPQNGSLQPLEQVCPACQSPQVLVRRAGKRPYRFCLNPECPEKEKWRGK